MATISLKLLVDKEKNCVVFAECDKDFIDILLSFLTLPMGTIIKLLDKQSSVGCMDKLYESVENLDAMYLETEACRTMLLQPRSAAEIACEDLKINIDYLNPRRLYRCPDYDCFTKTHRLYSLVCGARCRCGKLMDSYFQWNRKKDDENWTNVDGVFVKGSIRFIVSDDLHITPAVSMGDTLSILQKYGVKDVGILETRTVDVNRRKIVCLLKRLLISLSPLTDVFLRELEPAEVCTNREVVKLMHTTQIKSECDANTESTGIHVKVLYSILTKKVIFVQAGEDFVDVLFSFLTFPLGSIVKLLKKHSSIECLDNLYESVEQLAVGSDYIKSEECKNMLLAPKLSPHFGCNNQILRIEEKQPRGASAVGCKTCWDGGISKCKHGVGNVDLNMVNPKLPNSGTEFGGGYARKASRLMMMPEMTVIPFSPLSGLDIISESKIPICSLIEKEITIGEAEALDLLGACLISHTALSDVLS